MAQQFRIFISSPGDVGDERRRAALVISRLKREFVRFFELSAVLWEYEPMLGSGHFQDIIYPPSKADIVVLILWSRLGTPLPERTKTREYRGRDGRAPLTGTEWEFEEALEAREKHGGVPELLVYRKFAEGFARFSRAEEIDQIRQQWEALQSFWQRHFEGPDGSFKAAFNRFVSLDEFEQQLEAHLRELLRRRLPPHQLRLARPIERDRIEWWSGSPYRGLQAFDVDHAAVFFGRDRAEREITEALVHNAALGRGFVLVLGASGSGKSSLVRAGLLPDLTVPGVVEGISTWRHAIFHAAELAPDPFTGIAAALLRPKALPEHAAIGFTGEELSAQLRAGQGLAAVPLRLALERAAADDPHAAPGGLRQARLILVLDQMEVIFTSAAFTAESRRALDDLLAQLARCGLVWMIATMRSDFYHRLADMPSLNALATGNGQFQLATPNVAELEQIIRHPAEVAGLSFEADEDSGIGLDTVIRDAAARDPAALPLLSFLLDQLYRRDIELGGGSVLTYASYRELGRLEGAIAHHADKWVEKLPPQLASALPALLLALVEVDEIKGTATARTVRRSSLSDPRQRELAEHLVEARLAVADDTGTGQTVRLAHEALLAHWPRLCALIEEHRDFLIVRRRLQADAASWERHGQHDDFLLPPGRRLAEAEELLSRRRPDLDPEIVAYADKSIAAEQARLEAAQRAKEEALRRELERSRRVAAVVSVLLLLALAGGAFAWWQRGIATAARQQAEENYRLALDQAAGSVALLTESHDVGGISTKLMQALIERAQRTVSGLPGEADDVTAARAQLLDVLSLAYMSLGRVSPALDFATMENSLADGLVAKQPSNAQWQRLSATARGRLGDVLFWKGDLARALTQFEAATATATALAASGADDDGLQRDLSTDYKRLGDTKRALGEIEAASSEYRRWLDIAKLELSRHPGHEFWARSVGFGYQRLGDNLQAQGKPAEAAEHYRAYLAIMSQLVAGAPDNTMFQQGLSISHERLGDALLAQGNVAGALAEYEKYLELANKLLAADPARFTWHQDLEIAHQRLGEVQLKREDYASALQEFRTYLSMALVALAKDPSNGTALFDASNAQQKVADALRGQGKLDEALISYREALSIAEQLAAKDPGNASWQKLLAMSHQRMGMTLKAQGDLAAARAQFERCMAIAVKTTLWSPRTLWPPDVTGYCRGEIEPMGGAVPQDHISK